MAGSKTIFFLFILGITLITVSGGSNSSDYLEEWTINSHEHEFAIIPKSNEINSCKIEISSYSEVDIYILTNDQYIEFENADEVDSFERAYRGRTAFELVYEYYEDPIMWLLVVNPIDNVTATVFINFELILKGQDGIDDPGIDDSVCGGHIIAGTIGLASMTWLLVMLARRDR